MHKTVGEAFSWGGFGILDLIPGTRDMSFGSKFLLMLIILIPLIIFVLSVTDGKGIGILFD